MSARRGNRGAVLVHVAVALATLVGFSVVVLDYGVMWTARNQAQNAADAAALAAAVSLAYADPDDIPRAKAAAIAAGRENQVWGQAPTINAADVIIPYTCPPGAPGGADTCVRVNVYRNQSRDPLPVYFGPVVGIADQGVQAMAVAQVLNTNASDCVKPFAIPDKWIERRPVVTPWDWSKTFDRYVENGARRGELLSPDLGTLDEYIPPDTSSSGSPGSGFRLPDDYGLRAVLKFGNPHQTVNAGWYFPVDLPRSDGAPVTGGARYRANIASCNGVPLSPGDLMQSEPGGMKGPTAQGVRELVAPDPSIWDSGANAPACPSGSPNCFSRRIVSIPVFDVDAFVQADLHGRFEFPIIKILGFFIEDIPSSGPNKDDVVGHFIAYPGIFHDGGSEPQPSSFLRTVALVR